MNNVMLVGRLTSLPERIEENVLHTPITLAVNRTYQNSEGIYETDLIKCNISDNLANKLLDYCKIGDMVAVKGALENCNNKLIVRVEKLTFLSSKQNNIDE